MRRFRRGDHVVCYWTDSGSVLVNYATAVQAPATPLIWEALNFCGGWKTVREIRQHVMPRVPLTVVTRLLRSLRRATLIEVSDRTRDARERAMDGWRHWNPSAGLFHTVTRRMTFGDAAEFGRKLAAKAAQTPMPASVKPPARQRITLPLADWSSPLGAVLADRRTWRRFAPGTVSADDLAQVLHFTNGITHWLTIPGLGEVPLTSSPSGGARHPIETYVAAVRVRGIRPGLYRYAPDRHELDLVSRTLTARDLRRLLPRQPWFSGAAFVAFFAARFERTQWRYEFPRAYRAILLEAGHVCQTFLLAATARGLAPFSTMAIDDRSLESRLGLDGITEAVLYAAGAGRRPSAAGRVVMPARASAPVVRRQERQSTRVEGAAP
jgi:SagB-type dehydrogenase family enzyme